MSPVRSIEIMEENVDGLSVMEVADILTSGNSSRILIIDCRPFLAFNLSRIADAINIHCPPILKRRSGGFIALENIVPCQEKRSLLLKGAFSDVVVYDENTQKLNQAASDSNLISVIKSLRKQIQGENLTVRFIVGGFDAMKEACPVLCSNYNSHFVQTNREELATRLNEPAKILEHLYLGDESHSSNRSMLEQLGITALLNVSSTCQNHFQGHFQYMNVEVNDNMAADLLSRFPEVIDFIDKVASWHGKVLVHCRAGVSRSATVCIAYLMQKQNLSLDSAFDFVLRKRQIIDPNLNFIQQLQKFETNLRCKERHQLLAPPLSLCLQQRSAPPCFPGNPPSMFTFSPDHQHSSSSQTAPSLQADMDVSCSPPSSPQQPEMAAPPQSNPIESSNSELSPSSLSQTAASPSPMRSPVRPGMLPLLHISSPHTSQHQGGTTGILMGSSFLSPEQVSYPTSPFISMFQPSDDAFGVLSSSYNNMPRTPVTTKTFSFFNSDLTCQSISIPLDMASPLQGGPTNTATTETYSRSYHGSDCPFPIVPVPHSPLSPLSVPLSPLPSCG